MTDKMKLRRSNWKVFLQEFKSSGMSVEEYCKRKKVTIQTFYRRQRLVAKLGLNPTAEVSSFVQIKATQIVRSSVCRVQLGGIVLECLDWPPCDWLSALAAEGGAQ